MKRLLALFVAMLILMSVAYGEEAQYSMSGYDGESAQHDWNNNLFFTRMEERTGVSFLFNQFNDESQWKKHLQEMLNGAEMSEVLFKADLTDEETIDLYKAGILIDLRPYIETAAPNLNALLKKNPAWEKAITLPDGAIVALPCLNLLQSNDAMWINTQWLTNLKLDMPTTADELTEVLRAFRDGDPNMNGKKDEIPLSFVSMWELRYLGHAFGINTSDYYVVADENGNITSPLTEEKYRAFVEWLHLLWEEKLLSHDGFSTTDSMRQVTDKNATMTYGMFLSPSPIMLIPESALKQYAVVEPLEYEGKKIYRELLGDVVRGTFAITKECADPAKMLSWVDFLYTDEGCNMALYGVEDTEYVWNEKGYWQWNDTMENVINVVMPGATIGEGGIIPGYISVEHQLKYDDETTRMTVEQLNKLKQYCVLPVPQMMLGTEMANEISEAQAILSPYVEDTLAAFVVGDIELTDENWNNFMDGLKENGLDDMISLWQVAMDVYGGNRK